MMEDCRIVGQLHEFVPARVSDRKLRTAFYLASAITLFSHDLIAPWVQAFGSLGELHVQARLAAEIQRQASMIGYINAFHLMTLVPLLTAPLAFLFVLRRSES